MDEDQQNNLRKRKRAVWRYVLGVLLLGFVFVDLSLQKIPNVATLKGCLKTTMFEVNLCPGSSQYTPLSSISDVFLHAVIVSEDAAFFSHRGIDKHEIIESFRRNLKEGSLARGGSTITQQLIKNVYFDGEKSISRKIQEIFLAQKLEDLLTKKQILERYLNVIEFGSNLYGVKAAARHYFDKSPAELNLLESVYLVHLLPNPKSYSRGYYSGSLTDFSRERIVALIERLLRFKRINHEQVELAFSKVEEFPWKYLDPYDDSILRQTEKPLFNFGNVLSNDEPQSL